MNTDFLETVLNSLHHVFGLLVQVNVDVSETSTKEKMAFVSKKSITGYMNLISNNAQASIAVIIPDNVVLTIADKIMPEQFVRINEVVIDLVGEITNMIAGGVKGQMEEQGYLFALSLPTIILGSEYFVAHLPQSEVTQVDLNTELGTFSLEVCFQGGPDFCPLTTNIPELFDDVF